MWFEGLLKKSLGVLVSKKKGESLKKCELIGWHNNGYLIISGSFRDELLVDETVFIKFISKGIFYSCSAVIKFLYNEPFDCFVVKVPDDVTALSIRKESRFDAYLLGTILRFVDDNTKKTDILLKDISRSGALIEVRGVCRKCVVNEKIILSFPLPDGKMINNISAEIRNIRKHEDKVIAGVQFKADNNIVPENLAAFFEKEALFFE